MSKLDTFLSTGRNKTLPVFGNDWNVSQTSTCKSLKGIFLLLGSVTDPVTGQRKRQQEAELTFLRSESEDLKEDDIVTLISTGEKWVIKNVSPVDSVDIVLTIHSNIEIKRGGH